MKYYFNLLLLVFLMMIIASCGLKPLSVFPKEYQEGYYYGESQAKMDAMICLDSGLFGNYYAITERLEKNHIAKLKDEKSDQFMEGFKSGYRYYIDIYYPGYCDD